jgi:hypothetical protein
LGVSGRPEGGIRKAGGEGSRPLTKALAFGAREAAVASPGGRVWKRVECSRLTRLVAGLGHWVAGRDTG